MSKPASAAELLRLLNLIKSAMAQPARPGEEEWQRAQRCARAVLDHVQNEHGGRYNARGDCHTLRLGGISTSCTSGPAGLVGNWQRRALSEIGRAS